MSKTLLYNTKVFLENGSFAEAVGFDSTTGKIIFVGNNSGCNKRDYDEYIDLNGKFVLPAFSEGHCHFYKGSVMKTELNLIFASTKEDFRNSIRKYISTLKYEKWIQGGYFSEANFKENFSITKDFLDSINVEIPMLINRNDLHSAIINTKAIELTGIKAKMQEFGTEEIIVDDNGNLTGEVKERAFYFVLNQIPPLSIEETSSAVYEEIKYLHSLGITSLTDITLPEDLSVYKHLIEHNKLDIKINSGLPFEEFEKFDTYKGDEILKNGNIKFGTFKAFYDGSLGSESALFFKNYKGTNFNGLRTDFVNSGKFEKIAYEIDKAGYQLMVHAIGDKAVHELLDIVKNIESFNGKRDRRFRMEHCQHIRPDDFIRFRELGVIASVQPAHLYYDAKSAYEKVEDIETTHNYKNLIDIGVNVCFGTDFPVVAENPMETIYYAVTREAIGFENGFFTENKIDLATAINSYTINNSYARFEENINGSIAVNKDADIIVLDTDLFEDSSLSVTDSTHSLSFRGMIESVKARLKNTKIEFTFLNGTKVYEK
jgi:predicted amidohydrolase YtcJ